MFGEDGVVRPVRAKPGSEGPQGYTTAINTPAWSCRRALSFCSQNSIANLHRSLKNSHGFKLFEYRLKIIDLSAVDTQLTSNGTVIHGSAGTI